MQNNTEDFYLQLVNKKYPKYKIAELQHEEYDVRLCVKQEQERLQSP